MNYRSLFKVSAFFILVLSVGFAPASLEISSRQESLPDSLACSFCSFVVPENKGTFDGKSHGVKPGDVICLNAAFTYGTIAFKNLFGTKDSPVVITNCDGTIHLKVEKRPYNIKVSRSSYFRLTGGNTDGKYGIRISGSKSNGVVLGEFTTNFEVDHLEVFEVGFSGIMAKMDPKCDYATTRENFVMRDISFHHNYIHDTGGEGFYVGHTSYGGFKVKDCGVRLPHTIEGVAIHNNRVVRSGWDGIQLSCATKGAAVYSNVVVDYGKENREWQKSGIQFGGGSGGLCYGNFVTGGTGPGLVFFGLGDNLVYNNIIYNIGDLGIFCDERGETTGDGYRIFNNSIINPGKEGIAVFTETLPLNACFNNIIVNPGNFDVKGENAYILTSKGVMLEKSANFLTRSLSEVKFVDPSVSNFALDPASPAIDQGNDVADFGVIVDYYNQNRKSGAASDIGASEFQQ